MPRWSRASLAARCAYFARPAGARRRPRGRRHRAARHIKHVFVIFQENHSFDNYFGTFPGADNLASAEAQAHGFRQYDAIGKTWVTPFRIADPATESPSPLAVSSRQGSTGARSTVRLDAGEAFKKKVRATEGASVGLLTISHYDCDTIPFLWKYAQGFTLFDHIFRAMNGRRRPTHSL